MESMSDDIELLAKSAGADGVKEISDTPRTDAQTYIWENGGQNPFVHKEFAQGLERELHKAQSERDRAVAIADGMMAWETPAQARQSSKDLSQLKKDINE